MKFKPTDVDRPADEHLYNCLSIEHPNWRMHYKYFKTAEIVLEIRGRPILVHPETLFTPTNASRSGQLASAQGGLKGLRELYSGERPKTLADKFPTDAQAEVLHPRTIHPGEIRRICVQHDGNLELAEELAADAEFEGEVAVDPTHFRIRAGD